MVADTQFQADLIAARQFLYKLLTVSVANDGLDWLDDKLTRVAGQRTGKEFYLAFSAVPRYIRKQRITLDTTELLEADQLRKGFSPQNWTTVQLARTLLLLALPYQNQEQYLKTLHRTFETADLNELIALYGALPLLPYPKAHALRAAEGIRTNMTVVFEAIAHQNPYPAEYLEEGAWNQLVLKTVFIGKPLYRIYGLDQRSNARLAYMLSNYAHERWAASRTVTPELWRPVGPFIDENIIQDIQKLFEHPDNTLHEAAALACAHTSYPPAKQLLASRPALQEQIEKGDLTWNYIGKFAEVKV